MASLKHKRNNLVAHLSTKEGPINGLVVARVWREVESRHEIFEDIIEFCGRVLEHTDDARYRK